MTIMQSCDHHEPDRGLPDNRSRKRILEQFAAATAFGEAFRQLVLGSTIDIAVLAPQGLLDRPTITLDAEQFLACWSAFMAWHRARPRGDDLAPPVSPPAEIRVPPGGEPEDATS